MIYTIISILNQYTNIPIFRAQAPTHYDFQRPYGICGLQPLSVALKGSPYKELIKKQIKISLLKNQPFEYAFIKHILHHLFRIQIVKSLIKQTTNHYNHYTYPQMLY